MNTVPNGLPGLGIEPKVGRWNHEAVFFFSFFSFGRAKEKNNKTKLKELYLIVYIVDAKALNII